MGDEDGMESFEVNDFDLESAMNPGRRRRATKNQQIYGMWADKEDSEEEEEAKPSFGRKRPNYAAPVNFVSGGVKQGSKVEKEGEKDDDDDEPIELRPQFDRKKTKKDGGSKKPQAFAGMRGANASAQGTDPNEFGSWQKHTKSDVLMKMMKGMGYKPGMGLGAKGQGIVEPVQAVLRPGRAAIGAYGKEAKGPKFGESAADAQKRAKSDSEESEEDEKKASQKGLWRKNQSQKGPKYRYKTVDEVLADGGQLKKRVGGVLGANNSKVIDMTGPEQKIYSGYDAFTTKTKVPDIEPERQSFDIPELAYNLNLLVDITEEEIIRNDRQLKFLKDQTVALKRDAEELDNEISKDQRLQDRTREVLQLIEEFSRKSEAGEVSLEECRQLFETLLEDYIDEYKLFGLSSIAISNVLPLIKAHFSLWDPLDYQQTDHGLELMRTWRGLLVDDKQSLLANQLSSFDSMAAYDRLLWDAWMPAVRRAALQWNARENSEAMLRLVEVWLPVLPKWIVENLLEQIILPRLHEHVEMWNPMTDRVPIHKWLHPWLQVMGDRLQPVYPPIRHKLGKALTQWHPSDNSAKFILQPWKDVFAAGTFASFLAQHIVPKLEHALAEMRINPVNQDITPWNNVINWLDMVSSQTIGNILLRHFFPKWYETLCIWLDSPHAQFEEVAQWYSGWKARIPEDLLEIAAIR
uniref:G-patch domain-containing protein n=1 Tax=Plectus sambesii TaxID=2011161 RepID=A0A914X3D0_9BILA